MKANLFRIKNKQSVEFDNFNNYKLIQFRALFLAVFIEKKISKKKLIKNYIITSFKRIAPE